MLEPDLMVERTLPTPGLTTPANTGHTCGLEEPDLFNGPSSGSSSSSSSAAIEYWRRVHDAETLG